MSTRDHTRSHILSSVRGHTGLESGPGDSGVTDEGTNILTEDDVILIKNGQNAILMEG